MTNETVDRDVFQAMWRGLYRDVSWAGGWAVAGAVSRAVNRAVHGAVDEAVDGDVHLAVYETGAHHEAQPHSGLGIYLGGVPG